MTRRPLLRTLWIGAAAILVAAALVALVAVVRGQFSETDGKILITLAALLYSGGAALAGLALKSRGPAPQLGAALTTVAPVAFTTFALAIWGVLPDDSDTGRAAMSAVIVLAAGMLVTTALLIADRPRLVRLGTAMGALAAVAVVLSLVAVWRWEEPPGDFAKVLAAAWILTALAWALVPVLRRLSDTGLPPGERVLGTLDEVELVAIRGARPEDGLDIRLRPGERVMLRRSRPR